MQSKHTAKAMRNVVVTGLGTTNPLANTVDGTWQAALAGQSGVNMLEHEWVERYNLPVRFAAEVAVAPELELAKHEIKKMDRSAQFAVIAGRQAWADAGITGIDPERLGVVAATGIGGIWTLLDAFDALKERGPRRVLPMAVPMLMANGAAGNLAIELGARAGAHCPASACASGAEGLAYGLDMIRNGRADVVVAGGTEAAIHSLPIAGFAAMHALSKREDDFATASRPFCSTRDGFVLGEGCAMLVLEEEEHARARGAKIYARFLGAGLTSDANHIAAPPADHEGAGRALRQAMRDADITAADVTHINAHATATPAGDVAEAICLRDVLGSHVDDVVVTSTKSMTGHLLGGAGALEALFCVLSLRDLQCPPTTNIESLDSAINLDIAMDKPRDIRPGVALNNSFGFGGHNVALAFGSVDNA